MKNGLIIIVFAALVTACWPKSISFVDDAMPEEWKTFSVQTIENNAATAPLNYAATLTESIKDGIQNNSRLQLNPRADAAEVQIEGKITNYVVQPIALQVGDDAAKNRLTITTNFTIFISKPKEEEMTVTSTRFADYNSSQDLATVEAQLVEEINKQIVQDIINKLYANW